MRINDTRQCFDITQRAKVTDANLHLKYPVCSLVHMVKLGLVRLANSSLTYICASKPKCRSRTSLVFAIIDA